MVQMKRRSSDVLGPDEIRIVAKAYDLALQEIADDPSASDAPSMQDAKVRLSLAILHAFRNGVSDVQVLKIRGIASVRQRCERDRSPPSWVAPSPPGDAPDPAVPARQEGSTGQDGVGARRPFAVSPANRAALLRIFGWS